MSDPIDRIREAHQKNSATGNVYSTLRADDIQYLFDRLDDFETNGATAVRWAPSSAHWSNELHRLFGSDAREGIDNLERQLRDQTDRLNAAEAENERLREDAERLDSGCIRLVDRDDFGESVATVYAQVDLRAAIDAARREK